MFNILGPLANPAGVRRQVLGVASPALGATMAAVLAELGAVHALVVHGDGLDELSPSGTTRLWEVRDGHMHEWTLEPPDVGLPLVPRAALAGGDAARNAAIARAVLAGDDAAPRVAVLLNAGAACYVAGLAASVREGVELARTAMNAGAAAAVLDRFVETSVRLAAEARA